MKGLDGSLLIGVSTLNSSTVLTVSTLTGTFLSPALTVTAINGTISMSENVLKRKDGILTDGVVVLSLGRLEKVCFGMNCEYNRNGSNTLTETLFTGLFVERKYIET